MHWIYLSPHLDDVALSCGGLAWEQAQSGAAVSIWTICAGDPPDGEFSAFAEELHARWQTGEQAAAARRSEDEQSCAALGAQARRFTIPDAIYRRSPLPPHQPLYDSEAAIFGAPDPREDAIVQELCAAFERLLPPGAGLVCPLALGGHVDHQLVRLAAERLLRPLWYYADYPYALKAGAELDRLRALGWSEHSFAVSENGLRAWGDAVAAHASQVSTFWPDHAAMEAELERYCRELGGSRLWTAA